MKGDTRLPARSAPRRTPVLPPLQAARLLDQVRERARYLHFSLRTEQAYVFWVRAFVRFHGARSHPRDMGAAEVEAFLTWLANERHVAVSTHGQALSALLFLYQKVLGIDLPWMQSIGRPKRLARPLYGTGLRIAEAMQLRVKDVDFERRTLVVQRPPAADKLRHPHVAVRSPLDSLGT